MTASLHPKTGLRAGTFGIGTYRHGSRRWPGLVKPDGGVIDLTPWFVDTHAIFDDWERHFPQLVDIAARQDGEHAFDTLEALPPLAHPNLLCTGANYRQHVAEMLTKNAFNQHSRLPGESDEAFFRRNWEIADRRGREGVPFFWTGLHSSLAGAHADVVLPVLGHQHDWELELAAVVGRSMRYASVDEAASMIAGYVMVNDLGSVDQFRRTDIPWNFDWVSKHQPGFKVAGPFIVPAPFVRLDDDMRIQLRLNGQTMQDWPVTDMIFSIPQVLAYASERIRLLPGDLLLSGSPPGNGAHHGRFLQEGDLIESTITGLGWQRNRCRNEVVEAGRRPVFGDWPAAPRQAG